MNKAVGVIILAAGSSSRLGRPKQLLTFNRKTLLEHAVETASGVDPVKIFLVVGAYEESVRKIIARHNVEIVVNEEWATGIGSSIKKGVIHLLAETPEVQAAIIMVCDQPFLTTAHLKTLITTFETSDKPVVASGYHNTVGVPVLFDRLLFPELLKLENQYGAKKLIESRPHAVVPFPDGETDIDTEEDYTNLIN